MSKTLFSMTLNRDGTSQPWGFRLRGGNDLKEAFTVQRVTVGSPAYGELERGDILLNINGRPTSSLSHQEAHDLIKSAGNAISLVINRAGHQSVAGNPVSAQVNAAQSTAAPSSRKVSTVSGQPAAQKISAIMARPVENLPVTVFPPNEVLAKQEEMVIEERLEKERERIVVTHQPYRTTPLVLPGAKVRRDKPVPTQSYLALQSNPLLWSTTPSQPPTSSHPALQSVNEVLKQKLQDAAATVQKNAAATTAAEGPNSSAPQQKVVHKQFNSPLALYSQENVEQTLAAQTGVNIPNLPTVRHFNPRESETLRALMEEEATANARGLKEVRPATSKPHVNQSVPFKVNVMGVPQEKIQQSYSFKRIMADVLGETDF